MDASVQGALSKINNSYKAFSHNGKRMTKAEVEAVLVYANSVGYKLVSQIRDKEIDIIIEKVNAKIQCKTL